MTDVTLQYWIVSVDVCPVTYGPGKAILKLGSRIFHDPDDIRTYPHSLELRLDEQQLDQLLCRLQNLKTEMA